MNKDAKILGVLLGQGLLTARQSKRVESKLLNGSSLMEALQSVPIVDPLDVLRARQLAGVEPDPVKGKSEQRVSRDTDGISVIELPGFEAGTLETERVGSQKTERETNGSADDEIQTDLTEEVVVITAERTIEPNPVQAEVVNLQCDDGIPLVRRLNELLLGGICRGVGAIQLATGPQALAGFVSEYDKSGARLDRRRLEGVEVERMMARMKVLGRISPGKDNGTAFFLGQIAELKYWVWIKLFRDNRVRRMTIEFNKAQMPSIP